MNFEQLRHAAGLTCKEIAELAGVNIRQVFRWQAEEARVPKLVWAHLEQVLVERKNKATI